MRREIEFENLYEFNWNGVLKLSLISLASLAMWGGIIGGVLALLR
jgi:hypothetical protein